MGTLSFKDKKNTIIEMIRSISDHYGGNEEEWLLEYSKDFLKTHIDTLDDQIFILKKIMEVENIAVTKKEITGPETPLCRACGYMVPFCRCST